MKRAFKFLLAGTVCMILLFLSITMGLHLILPFESIWAEVGFVCILGLGASLFLTEGIITLIKREVDRF